jgi:ubiquinone/menaquinone biosynthesis C-methylase UbiE
MNQAEAWSAIARDYEKEFVDPYREDQQNPFLRALERIPNAKELTVADFGCGTGPLLPFLAERFGTVLAIDFAPKMLERARERVKDKSNVQFLALNFADLSSLHGKVDIGTSVNSLVLPHVGEMQQALQEMRRSFKPGGRFYGIVPAMDGVHYYTMLLLDRALATGKPLEAARKNAAYFAEHATYDFAFGQFLFRGIEQHFWTPFELRYRFRRAGFRRLQLRKLHLSWTHFAKGKELDKHPAPWDWCFLARV